MQSIDYSSKENFLDSLILTSWTENIFFLWDLHLLTIDKISMVLNTYRLSDN